MMMFDGWNKRLVRSRGRTFARRTTGHAGGLAHRKYWFALIVVLGATVLYHNRLRVCLKQASFNVRAFDLPSAGAYDAVVASVLEGFYARVAGEVAGSHPSGKVLEVGSGPGRLAVRLAREAPNLAVIGVDISDAMVERATRRAAGAGLLERVRFEVGEEYARYAATTPAFLPRLDLVKPNRA